MPTKVKDDWLGGRVDAELKAQVEEYIDTSPSIETQGQLIRKAVIEYMKNHPIEEE